MPGAIDTKPVIEWRWQEFRTSETGEGGSVSFAFKVEGAGWGLGSPLLTVQASEFEQWEQAFAVAGVLHTINADGVDDLSLSGVDALDAPVNAKFGTNHAICWHLLNLPLLLLLHASP